MKLAILGLLFTVAAYAQQSPIVPAACGASGSNFEVSVQHAEAPSTPPSTEATIYFIQDDGQLGNRQHFTIKIAIDGSWVGAYKANSYFFVRINPGVHHLCASVQSKMSVRSNVALAHFMAKAGETYYFRTQFLAGIGPVYNLPPHLILDRPDSDEAKYLIASYPLSISHLKK